MPGRFFGIRSDQRSKHDGEKGSQDVSESHKQGRDESRWRRASAKPALLSGGNPQIAKGYGDAPVQAYIAAMPGWKREIGRRLDALIARAVPGVARR